MLEGTSGRGCIKSRRRCEQKIGRGDQCVTMIFKGMMQCEAVITSRSVSVTTDTFRVVQNKLD